MNWNYDFIIAELMVICVVGVYYHLRPRLPLIRNRLYRNVLFLEVIVILSDAMGAYALEHYIDCKPLSYGINMIYFGSFFLRAAIFFLLSLRILKIDYKKNRHKRVIHGIGVTILLIINFSTPYTKWIFYIEDHQYFRGKLYWLTYGQFIFYVISIFGLELLRRKKLDNKSRKVVPIAWTILSMGYLARFFFSHMLIANIFYMAVIIIILFTYSDPESFVDSRTGLYNERGFTEMIDEKIGIHGYKILSIIIRNHELMCKVFTHADYYNVMSVIGIYLKQLFPRGIVFFFNDGQFVVLMDPNYSTEKIKTQIVERFTQKWQGKDNSLYFNVGIVEMDSTLPFSSTDEILQNIYTAGIKINKEKDIEVLNIEKIRRQILVRNALERALQEDGVQLYLHPIVKTGSREIIGAEALARLKDEELGVIGPEEFISFSEDNGSIIELGMQIFRKSCEFLKRIQGASSVQWINVNLSPIQCMDPELPDRFREILERYELPISAIHLEITEEAFVDASILGNRIEALTKQGFSIVLDDFGSGYNNLARLVNYPMKSIKLDRSMIASHFKNHSSVLTTLIPMLKERGYNLAAEGVEEEYMLEKLEQIGFDYMQGFYFSKPISESEFESKYVKIKIE